MIDEYIPPERDPRTEANAEWDRMRNELLTIRDQLNSANVDREVLGRQVDALKRDLATAKSVANEAMREAMSYRTSFEDVGRLILAILKRGIEDRKGGDEYAPPAIPSSVRGDPVSDEDIRQVEDIILRRSRSHKQDVERNY